MNRRDLLKAGPAAALVAAAPAIATAHQSDDEAFIYHINELMKLFEHRLPDGCDNYALTIKRASGAEPHLRWNSVEAVASAFGEAPKYWSLELGKWF